MSSSLMDGLFGVFGKPARWRWLAYTDAMRANCKAFLLAPLLTACAVAAAPALAQTVYRSVEDGVPTFSDAPPDDDRPVETITLDVPEPAEDPQLAERLAQMREATDRMAADRREREAHRAALREQQQAAPPEPQAPTVITANSGYWPAYLRPHRPPHVRPPLRPRPLPAPAPPPGWSVMRGGNAQLMRPIVSSRR